MSDLVTRIVVVGGGTAGWLTACVIAARHCKRISAGRFSVTLVESPNINTIGVGEGTWPTLRSTLEKIGVSETTLFRECDAAFKQGAKFSKWTTGAADDYYYHPLMLPQSFSQMNLAPHWLRNGNGVSFCDAVSPQGQLCDAGLAPKNISTPEYQAVANYAYHLDAGKFAPFLMRHGVERLGIRHVLAEVTSVNQAEAGDIISLDTDASGPIEGDLFVDCTGFNALLLGKTLGVPFRDHGDVLFCDSALAVQVPYDSDDAPLSSQTNSTALKAGWAWDIGLPTRRGVGYVWSSRHSSEADAYDELAAYVGPAFKTLNVRKIPIRSGHRETFWKNNCVAVGLAAGFLEPLEASAIVLIELSAKLIAEQMPANRQVMDIVAKRFNETTHYRWGRIIDFLKLHYSLTQRSDTPFWRDNRDPATIPERLQDLMTLWKYQSPWFFDEFDRLEEVFPAASYQYVLYGMGFKTEVEVDEAGDPHLARRLIGENLAMTQRLRKQLPRNRELIRKIHDYGFQSV